MRAFVAALTALGGFFLLLNALGGIVAGLWLAVLGQWWAIGLGFFIMVVSTLIISLALLPSAALGGAAYAMRRSKSAFMLIGLLSNLYIAAVMTVWSVGMLTVFMGRASAKTWIPLVIWSYGAALGPWQYMASKEQGDSEDSSALAVMFAQVGYVVMVIVGILAGLSLLGAVKIFGGIMLVYVILNVLIASSMLRQLGTQQPYDMTSWR